MHYVIDRIEAGQAVVVGDDGRALNVPAKQLPKGAREGVVLRLPESKEPDWSRAVVDEAERVRRIERSKDVLRRLENSDPGGDIVL